MEGLPALLQQALVDDFVREGVLEGVFQIREEAGLVEELGGPEVPKSAPKLLLGEVRDGVQEGRATSLPITAAD